MKLSAICYSLFVCLCSSSLLSEEWNQWRGPTRDGVVTGGAEFPKVLKGDALSQQWSVKLAEGYSSPIVAGNTVFTLETQEKKAEIARAFDVVTGKLLWEKKWQGAMKVPFFAAKNGSWVKCTPITDGKSVYFGGMRDVLVKLDVKSGEEIWRIDFTKREGTQLPSFGYISSPLLDDGFLYVQAGSAIAKINAETGKNVWRVLEDDRAMFGNAFSSPIIAELAGSRQLIVQNRMNMVGLDLETGKSLWQIPVKAFRGMNILTPTISGNHIFTATYGGGAFCYEVKKADDGSFSITTIWNDPKLEGYMSSPILIDGHLYLHGRDQKFHCVVFKDGSKKWSSEEKFGEYWSLLRKGNRVLALDQKGELIAFDASPEKFTILDRRKVSDQSTWAHIGIANDVLFVRGLRSLAAFKWQN